MMKRCGLLPVLALAILVGCTDGNDRSLMGPTEKPVAASEGGGGELEGAKVWTDKDDYLPGDTVSIFGVGWWPGETVHLHITEDPQNHPDHDYYVEADEAGTFVHRELVMDDDHLDVTFMLTSTGQSSGYVAVTTFTDGHHIEFFHPATSILTHSSEATRAEIGTVDRGATLIVPVRIFLHTTESGGHSGITTVTTELFLLNEDDAAVISPWIDFSENPVTNVTGGSDHALTNGKTINLVISPSCEAEPDTYNGRIQSDVNSGGSSAFRFRFTVNEEQDSSCAEDPRETETILTCTPGAALANGTDEIECTATVTDVDETGTKSAPTGLVEFSHTPGIAFAFPDPDPDPVTCNLVPDQDDPLSTCSVKYRSHETTLEEIVAAYEGSATHEESTSEPFYIAFFDPTAGFVTGGGWIWSPLGAYAGDPDLEGRANFGVVAQYQQRGRNTDPVLAGNTQFVFQAAGFNFHSSSYDWLVVQGGSGKAQFKGWGTVNGANGYQFMVSVEEGGIGAGKFRIKIWSATTLDVVYDNQEGAADNAELDADAQLRGGSIVIHTAGNKNQGGGNK